MYSSPPSHGILVLPKAGRVKSRNTCKIEGGQAVIYRLSVVEIRKHEVE